MKKIIIILLMILSLNNHITYAGNDYLKLLDANNSFKNKDFQSASKQYEEYLVNGEVSGIILNNLFISYVYIGDFEKAEGLMTYLIKINGPKENLVGTYIKDNNLSKKIVDKAKEISDSDKKDVNQLINYSKLLYEAGDYYYEKDSKKYYMAIMLHYISAYNILTEALNIDDKNSEIYFYQGRLLMDISGDFKTAENKLRKAIELNKNNFEYYYRLGNSLKEQGKNKEARDEYIKGLKLNSNYEKLYLNLGNAYMALGENTLGLLNYKKGLKICSKECISFNRNLGTNYERLGKYTYALLYYNKLLKLDENYRDVKEKVKNINKICNF